MVANSAQSGTAPLFVHRWGDGPPVLFLHGLCASGQYWTRLAACGSGYAGIAPDLLGFGRSPKPPTAAYDVADHVEMLLPLVPDGCVIVAHSTGSILAAALAASRSTRVAGLLLLGLPAFPDEATARADIGRLGLLPRLTVKGARSAELICRAMCRSRPLLSYLGPKLIHDLPPEIVTDFLAHTWQSYSGTLLHVVVEHRVRPDLLTAGVPTILVAGREDKDAPISYLEALAADLAEAGVPATLRVFDGDHHLAVRHPDRIAALLTQLVDRIRP